MNLLFEIDGTSTVELVEKLKKIKEVKRVYFARSSPNKSLVMIILKSPRFCKIARNSNAFCVSCPYNSLVTDGKVEWDLLVNDESDREKLIHELELNGEVGNAKRVENALREEALTSRQREILLAAIQMGYFDFPRKTGLTELAKSLNIRPSTLSEIIRLAESKIAKAYAWKLVMNGSIKEHPRAERMPASQLPVATIA